MKCWIVLFILFIAQAKVGLSQELPTLPKNVEPPNALTLKCMQEAKTFTALEVCRVAAEAVRDATEEYNKRITRFCNSITKYDGLLRSKAKRGRLSWVDYEELKVEIQKTLEECEPNQGDYFTPYRARMREYASAMKLYKLVKKLIVKGVGL